MRYWQFRCFSECNPGFGGGRMCFQVECEFFSCPILISLKSGTTVANLATLSISSAESCWFTALVWQVVPVGMGSLIVFKSVFCWWFLFVRLSCQRQKLFVCVCVYLYVRKYTICIHIQSPEFHEAKKKVLPFPMKESPLDFHDTK